MKQKITCFCENAFDVEIPGEFNLDTGPYLEEIQNGTFLNFTCSSCGKKHKPEFQITLVWPSKKIRFEVFPELDRGEFYRRKKQPPVKEPYRLETLIGYPEMADRLAVIRDGFEPAAIEAIKYFLHIKAEEQYPEDEPDIWYYGYSGGKTADEKAAGAGAAAGNGSNTSGGKSAAVNSAKAAGAGAAAGADNSGSLEFHIHGIRENEVAVTKVPYSLYQKTLEDYKNKSKSELFNELRVKSYLSVKNTLRPETFR